MSTEHKAITALYPTPWRVRKSDLYLEMYSVLDAHGRVMCEVPREHAEMAARIARLMAATINEGTP